MPILDFTKIINSMAIKRLNAQINLLPEHYPDMRLASLLKNASITN